MKYKVKYTIPTSEGEPSMTITRSFIDKNQAENFANNLRTVGVQFRRVSGTVSDVTISEVKEYRRR